MGTGNIQVLQWRKFEFFNVEEGADVGSLQALLQSASIQCGCSGRGLVLVGDNKGFVHCLGRALQSSAPSFPAHDAPVAGVWTSDAAPVIVTLAHPKDGCSEVKVWAPDRLHEDHPTLLRLLRPDPRPPPPKNGSPNSAGGANSVAPRVTALALHPNINMLALGFSSGAIMLYRGDLGKDRAKNTTSRVLVTVTGGITNMHFRLSNHTYTAPPNGKGSTAARKNVSVSVQSSSLLVTTDTNIYSIACTHRDKETTTELDSVGCRSGCSALVDGRTDHNFVIARDDALYCYSSEGRAGCYAFPGHKRSLCCHRGYAVVVAAGGSGSADEPVDSSKSVVTIYDLSNKVIALVCNPPSPLVGVVGEWGALYGLTNDPPTLLYFREKDLHTKMEILFKKNQYDIAVSLAKGQSVSGEGVAEILKQYGDWLYSKGDLAMAVHQYIKTIPHLEPSYVIKKFLSSEHTSLLALYLEALHALNLHSPDHSSLLLNCYTRHKHDHRIQAFIQKHSEQVTHARKFRETQKQKASNSCDVMPATTNGYQFNRSISSNNNSSHFNAADVEVLVGVCREGGFHEEALQLTSLHQLHSLHLDILCNDTHQYRKAIQYLRSLELYLACTEVVSHGTALARGCPDDTLELLIELATDYTPDNTPIVGEAPLDSYLPPTAPSCAAPELFESVVCGDSLLAIRYIEGVTKRHAQLGRPPPAPRLCEMLLAEYLHQLAKAPPDGIVREAWEHKVQGLISEGRSPIDPSLACLLCERHGYHKGKLLIWHQHNMWSEILQYHVFAGSESEMLTVCQQQEHADTGLWLTALRLLTAPSMTRSPDTRVLTTLLDKVDEHSLLPPMEVIDLLSASDLITLGQVRGYLLKLADREEQIVAHHQHSVDECVAKTEAIRDQIDHIQTSGLVFTESKCDACQKELEFPTVHFFCKHSFHQHCFVSFCSSSDEECPVCLPRHNAIRDRLTKQASERNAIQHFNEPATPTTVATAAGDAGVAVGDGYSESDDDVFKRLSDYLAAGLFTDYTAALATQQHHHTDGSHSSSEPAAATPTPPVTRTPPPGGSPAPVSKQEQQRLSSAALETSHVTESRMRLAEAHRAKQTSNTQPTVSSSVTSEGRLRQVPSKSTSPRLLDTREGRVRSSETGRGFGGSGTSSATEARLRSAAASSVTARQSEARLREQQGGGRKFGGTGVSSNPSSPATQRVVTQSPAVRAPRHTSRPPDGAESISSALSNSSTKPHQQQRQEHNPFESDDALEATNPFGEDFSTEELDTNPFADDADTKSPFKAEQQKDLNNPFGDADYDQNLNPFGE